MQDTDVPRTQSLIDRYYEEEREQREKDQMLAELSLKMDANDLSMLGMIARRFRKTRDEVAQEVLSNALTDLFACIEPGERKLMARDADDAAKKIADSIAEENGVRDVEIKTGYWAQHDRQFVKLEKQREKIRKEAEVNKTSALKTDTAKPRPEATIEHQNETSAEKMTAEVAEHVEDSAQYSETAAIDKTPAAIDGPNLDEEAMTETKESEGV